MGRAKLPIRLINPERSRHTTFTKRKKGLKKKIFEFTTLCDVDACMIIYGSAAGATPEMWPEDPREVQRIIEQFRKAPVEERDKRRMDISGFVSSTNKRLQAELERKRAENAELVSLLMWNRTSLEAMDLDTVLELELDLHSKIKTVNEMAESLRRKELKLEDQGSQSEIPIRNEFYQHHRSEYVSPLQYSIPASFIVPPLQSLPLPQGGNDRDPPVAFSGQGTSMVDPFLLPPGSEYCKSMVDPIPFGHGSDYYSYTDPMSIFLSGTYNNVPFSFPATEVLDPLTGAPGKLDPIQGFEDQGYKIY